MATLSEHAAAIQAAIDAANDDGVWVVISNTCSGCCSDFEIYATIARGECVDLVI